MSEEKQIIENGVDEAVDMVPETEESFAEMVDRSIKTLHTGQRVTGIVTQITPTDIHVDLGTKQAGFIPVSELSDDPSAKPEDIVHIGDEIEVFVTKVNDSEGIVTLSTPPAAGKASTPPAPTKHCWKALSLKSTKAASSSP